MVPGRGDRRSTSVAVRRTCGAESELGKEKIGRGRCDQTQNTKKKTIIGTRIQIQTSTSPIAEAPPAAHDARTSACSGLPLNRSCSMQYCHVIYWAV